MRRVLWLAGLLLLAVEARAEEAIYFEGPKESKPEDLKKCAGAMVARCKAYGFERIVAGFLERDGKSYVEVKCETGFTEKMREVVRRFAAVAGKQIDLREERKLSSPEAEQYGPAHWDAPERDRAPKGWRWFRMMTLDLRPDCSGEGDSKTGRVVLLGDTPVASRTDLGKVVQVDAEYGGKRAAYRIPSALTKKWQAANPDAQHVAVYLVVDGLAVSETLSVRIRMSFTVYERGIADLSEEWVRFIDPLIQFPMPFALVIPK